MSLSRRPNAVGDGFRSSFAISLSKPMPWKPSFVVPRDGRIAVERSRSQKILVYDLLYELVSIICIFYLKPLGSRNQDSGLSHIYRSMSMNHYGGYGPPK